MLLTSQLLPKISIVTPSFNQGQFLEATILSVLSQNYPNLEYIIMDGGSSDESVSIIKKYESQLTYWCSEPDAGQYAAINKGFERATGEIMAWLNSDDLLFPWSLNVIGTIMNDHSEVEWVSSLQPGSVDSEGFLNRFGHFSGFSRAAFLNGHYLRGECRRPFGWIQQESTFWRADLWRRSGGLKASEFDLAGDFDLWGRFFRTSQLFGITSPLGAFRIHANQRSSAIEKYCAQARLALRQARRDSGWSDRPLRDTLYALKFHKIPVAKSLHEAFYGYEAKRLVRREGRWAIENYLFV